VALRLTHLTKRFGTLTAVDGLDLEVRAGEVVGFLGPNGSGKSTTVGMILGLIAPTSGSIEVLGRAGDARQPLVRRKVGAIVEAPAFYPYLSGRDNLHTIALAAGGVPRDRVDDLLAMVGLAERAGSPYRTYSLGMKQRLGLASTLLTDPDLVILDEPTNGLDPAGQREIRGLIPRLAREGRAVLVASHLLHEVEQVCDRVAIIQRGRLLRTGNVSDLLGEESLIDVEVPDPAIALPVIEALPFVSGVTREGDRLRIVAARDRSTDINQALAARGIYAAEIVRHRNSLEDVFIEVTANGLSGSQPGEERETHDRHAS
jgi:ABC-2 type transport system ATP-binding protein